MSSQRRVAIVTGCNNSIMLSVARELCKRFDGDVIMTASNSNSCGCVAQLKEEGFRPMFFKLDTTNKDDIDRFNHYIKNNYSGIDVLFHNAAIVRVPNKTSKFSEGVNRCINANFFGTLTLINSLWRLLKPRSRICVVVCSTTSPLLECSSSIQLKLKEHSENKTIEELGALMGEFLYEGQKGSHFRLGWATDAFGMSQLATVVLVNILARKASQDYRGDIEVSCCTPSRKTSDVFGYNIPLLRNNTFDVA